MAVKTTYFLCICLLLQVSTSESTTDPSDDDSGREEIYQYELDMDLIREERKKVKQYAAFGDDWFTFHLFENFEMTREVFRDELKLIKSLRALREHFINKLTLLRETQPSRLLDEPLVSPEPIPFVSAPVQSDFEGALRGLVFLHDTYDVSLSKLMAPHQTLVMTTEGLSVPNAHPLGLEDFYRLTKLSFMFKWYDRAIEFLRAGFRAKEKLSLAAQSRPKMVSMFQDMEKMKKNLIVLNNQNLFHSKKFITDGFKTLSYEVGSSLKRKKTQPNYVDKLKSPGTKSRHEREAHVRRVCNGHTTKPASIPPHKCKLIHHHDPYLRLGPFKAEIASDDPVIMVFHDFFTEAEMTWLVEYSRPRLSRGRYRDMYNEAVDLGLRKGAKNVTRVIHKSVQYWITDIEYEKYYDNLHEYEDNDRYTVHFPNLFKLSKKIALASQMNTTAKYATTDYQTTNYGLGGLCESHYDPHGYIEGQELPPHPGFQRLRKQGDMIATVMGWLEDVPAGGYTAFADPGNEVLVRPTRGSAAFWLNLDRKGFRDRRLLHGGCPIIMGSKWIMNKWIFYFDQFKNFQCGLEPNEFFSPYKGHY